MQEYYWSYEKIPLEDIQYNEVVKKGISYINLPVSFDIETTSFMEDGEYRANMYVWQMCIGENLVILGRTWDSWLYFLKQLRTHFHTYRKRHLIIYVHNLAYEFTWIRRLLQWDNVFSMEPRRPLYAISIDGFEFRCSYLLSGMNLAKVADNLMWHDIRKLTGDLDYRLKRHSTTTLWPREIAYCINDVKIVTAYIAERIKADGNITKIPLTKTGYVRNDCRRAVYGTSHKTKQYKNYRGLMKMLQIAPEEYEMLKNAFQGGFTHANVWKVGHVIPGVESKDFTSSYPTVMIANQFPMSRGVPVNPTIEEFEEKQNLYCWILEIEFTNICAAIIYENYISESRCSILSKDADTNNGRVVRAAYLKTTITNVDYEIIKRAYKWDEAHIFRAYRYKKGYLPKRLINTILDYYEKKTTLKDVAGKEVEYLEGKERVNSIYGMMVTDILRDIIEYDEEAAIWEKLPPEPEALEKENNKTNRFIFYPWGVFVTAYARYNLWTGIFECKTDYCYADTDSIKIINADAHEDYFNKYNKWITDKLEKACEHHGIDPARIRPKTIKGIEKPLGVWDFDGSYKRFKTLGAKRYLAEYDNGKFLMTVAGLNKKGALNYLLNKYGSDGIFNHFKVSDFGAHNGLIVPKDHSGRLIMSYIDYETNGTMIDYMGEIGTYHEKSSVHMEASTYEMSIGRAFFEYLKGFTEVNL